MNNKFMNIKEIAELCDCNERTVQRKVKEKFPELIKNGTITMLDEFQSKSIVSELRKKGLIEARQNVEVQFVTKDEIKEIITETLKIVLPETIKQILPLIQNNKQISYNHDYFSILGYCRYKGFEVSFSDRIKLGKEATKLSKINKIEIRKIPDERYGEVNSYQIRVLEKVFEL